MTDWAQSQNFNFLRFRWDAAVFITLLSKKPLNYWIPPAVSILGNCLINSQLMSSPISSLSLWTFTHTHTRSPPEMCHSSPTGVASWHPVTVDRYHRSRGVGCSDPTSSSPPILSLSLCPMWVKLRRRLHHPTPTSPSLPPSLVGWEEWRWLMCSGGSGGVEPGSSSALAQSRDLRGHTKAGIDPGRARWWNLPPPMILIHAEGGGRGRGGKA